MDGACEPLTGPLQSGCNVREPGRANEEQVHVALGHRLSPGDRAVDESNLDAGRAAQRIAKEVHDSRGFRE